MSVRIVFLFVLSLGVFSSCNQQEVVEKPSDVSADQARAKVAFMKDVDAARAGELVKMDPAPVVLDVRTPDEFAEGHIEGAINIDIGSPAFKEDLAKLDKDVTYLLHCRSGGRSGKAKPICTELGFSAIYHLDGGLMAWEDAGLPTVK